MRRPSRSPGSSAPSSPAEGGRRKGRPTPCCTKEGLKRGPWTPEEDEVLSSFVRREGEGRWRTLPKRAGLLRCGKSCRLRWMNYLRPSIKHGGIAPDEEDLILRLHRLLGNRWSLIAGRIPGRTDNEIKNYWNSHLSKKLISQGLDPRTHKPLNPNPNPNPNPVLQDQRMKAPMQAPIAPNPNPNPEPNGEPNFVSSNLGETYDWIGKSMGNFFQVGESSIGSAGIDLDCGELWRGPKEVGMVSMQEKGHNGVDFGIADDAFYSFIDSIINQDLLLQELHEQIIISNEDDGNGNGDDNA